MRKAGPIIAAIMTIMIALSSIFICLSAGIAVADDGDVSIPLDILPHPRAEMPWWLVLVVIVFLILVVYWKW